MSCETKQIKNNDTNVQEKQTNSQTYGSLVLRKAPLFITEAYDSENSKYIEVDLKEKLAQGKWIVVCFYPADFTFVCPTEIAAMNAMKSEFDTMNTEIIAVSTDTKFSHKRFVETEPLLKDMKLTMAADPTGNISRAFGVMIEEEGVALRGRFLINPDGIVVAQEVQAPSVGRNVKEFLRQVRAWQYATKTGEVCPAGWEKEGDKTLPVNTDVEKMTGRVGDYITIDDIIKK